MKSKNRLFIEYFKEFYGLGGLYRTIPNLTDEQISAGISALDKKFTGDSVDREYIRDLILQGLGYPIEHNNMPKAWIKKYNKFLAVK